MPRSTRPSLIVEPLESRDLPANTIGYSAVTRVLVIDGSPVKDMVKVVQVGTAVQVTMTHPGSSLAARSVSVAEPIGKITFQGYDGDDYFENRINAPVVADAGKGNDYLIGGPGNDFLSGTDGADILDGGAGNDQLYGGPGNDTLYGGAGNDALAGRAGFDILIGNAGGDRFLMTDNDLLLDKSAADARINFVGFVGKEVLDGIEIVGTHASWNDADIQAVDHSLAVYEQRTRNTSLLKMPDGSPLTFRRQGHSSDPDSLVLGWNTGDGNITLLDYAFEDPAWLHRTVFHEIGHNWDDMGTNRYWNTFTGLSGWTYGARSPGAAYTKAPETDQEWWFKSGAVFTRDYGRTNPWEDWAVSVEAYFSQTYTNEMEAGAAKAPAKINVVNQFLTSKTS